MKYLVIVLFLLTGCSSMSVGTPRGSVTAKPGGAVINKGHRPVIVIDTDVHECKGDPDDPACKIEKQYSGH